IDAGIRIYATPTPTRTPTPVNIGNFVWDDLNGDGVQDGGEPGIPDVVVQLWHADKTSLIDQDVTDANGIYSLQAPQPMEVRVRVVTGPGSMFTLKDVGSDTADSDINWLGGNAGYTDVIDIASNVI